MIQFTMTSSISILCLLGLYICISMADRPKCPAEEDIYPCSCTEDDYLYVTCNADDNKDPSIEGLQKVLKALPSEPRIDLRLYSYEIGIMPSKLFQGLNIKELVIGECYINGFEENAPAFYGLEDSLKELYITSSLNQSSLHSSPVNIGHLRNLQLLDMSYHNRKTHYFKWKNDPLKFDNWFTNGPVSLKSLHMYNNKYSDLGENVFSKLVNLKELDLQHNRIKVLKRSMFPNPAEHLAVINLNYNDINELPEDIFHNMPALRKVYFSDNLFMKLHENVWKPIWEQLDVFHVGDDMNCDKNVIDWMINLKMPEDLWVNCNYPGENKDLKEVLDERRQ